MNQFIGSDVKDKSNKNVKHNVCTFYIQTYVVALDICVNECVAIGQHIKRTQRIDIIRSRYIYLKLSKLISIWINKLTAENKGFSERSSFVD